MKEIKLKFEPRQYQLDRFLSPCLDLIESNPDQWHLFSSPTGTGKSIMELMLLQEKKYWILVTPRIEIIAGMLQKMNYDIEDMTTDQIVTEGQYYRIFTPIRLRNILAQGRLRFMPEGVIIDEAHHDLAETYQDLMMYLNHCPKVGLTATPYRGNPKDSVKFLEQWGNTVHEVLTLQEAIESGYFALPQPTIWPLVDDDIITVSNGEFNVKHTDGAVSQQIPALIDRIKSEGLYSKEFRLYDRATMLAVTSTELVNKFVKELNRSGLPAVGVTQVTNRHQRSDAFASMVRCEKILVQIDVVSEGVDLPIERIIDCKPTMSPVRWVQQIGRFRKVKDADSPQYICTCRNIERHGYLMEGYFPNAVIKEAQEIFGEVSKRSGIRAVGMEGLGKFVKTPVHLTSGITAFMYNLVTMDGYERTEYCVIVHPNHKDTLKAKRVSRVKERGERTIYDWGKWNLIESIPDLKGFASAKPTPLTDKQAAWFKRDGEKFGLNPFKEVNNRNFQVLPLLTDISAQTRHVVKLV